MLPLQIQQCFDQPLLEAVQLCPDAVCVGENAAATFLASAAATAAATASAQSVEVARAEPKHRELCSRHSAAGVAVHVALQLPRRAVVALFLPDAAPGVSSTSTVAVQRSQLCPVGVFCLQSGHRLLFIVPHGLVASLRSIAFASIGIGEHSRDHCDSPRLSRMLTAAKCCIQLSPAKVSHDSPQELLLLFQIVLQELVRALQGTIWMKAPRFLQNPSVEVLLQLEGRFLEASVETALPFVTLWVFLLSLIVLRVAVPRVDPTEPT
mmetsp:Transcript_28206/g.61287  ORF Transcript_28206/g.61287 Transcript_28206/m.61287 type:complete len:266 (-) Transcript_28206:505-1302(-)